jgi:hypothetical protein
MVIDPLANVTTRIPPSGTDCQASMSFPDVSNRQNVNLRGKSNRSLVIAINDM